MGHFLHQSTNNKATETGTEKDFNWRRWLLRNRY